MLYERTCILPFIRLTIKVPTFMFKMFCLFLTTKFQRNVTLDALKCSNVTPQCNSSSLFLSRIDVLCKLILILSMFPEFHESQIRYFKNFEYMDDFNLIVSLRITDEGSVPEMCIWSIMVFKSDLKCCIYFNTSYFLY